MKKDKLYTYGKKGNIFWPGGELNSYGWMPEQMQPIASPVYKPLTVPTLPKYENFGSKNLGTFNIPTVTKAQPLSSETIGKTNNYYNQQVSEDGGSSPSFYNAASKVLSTAGPGLVALGSDGYSTNGVGEGISTAFNAAGDLASTIPGVGAVAAPILKTIGIGAGIIANRGWGVKENKKNTAAIKENTALAKSVGNELGSASTNSDVLNAASNMTSSLGFKASDLYKNGWFTKKGTKKGNALRNQEAGALAYQNHALTTGAENADYNMDSNIMRNFAAFGGPIDSMGFIEDMPATSYGFMKDYLTQREKQIDSKNKLSGISPTNAFCGGGRMFHGGGCLPMMFDFGGNMGTNSSDFPTGLTHIDAGGSHEINPNEGVQVGVDQEGTPNLVEEGETIFNDYVFSNRIEVPQEAQKRLGVKGKHLTFAEAAKQLEKEIKERANDPISKAGFKAAMEDLEEEQEFVKRCSMYSVGEVYDVDSNELMLLNQNGYEYKKLE